MSPTRPGDQRTTSAANAAELLQGDEPGVLLVGPAAQTGHAIRLILDRLSDRSVMPIGFAAPGATPAMLRQEVGQAHAARPSPDTDLLLVVAQADRLSPDLLHELEMAAEAAATHGGLKFLFAAPRDLSASLQRAELRSLAACVRTRLPVLSPPPPALDPLAEPQVAAPSAGQASERPYPFNLVAEPLGVTRHAQPARPVPRIMLAIGILGILGLVVTGALVGHRPAGLPAPATQATQALPPTTSTVRLPAVPDAVPPSPTPTSPPGSTSSPDAAGPSAPPTAAAPVPASPPPAASVQPPAAAPSQPVASSPAAPAASPPPPAEPSSTGLPTTGLPADRIDAGRIVPQLAPARHASLLLLAGPDDTLSSLYEQVYRGTTPPPYAQVVTLNPVVRSGVRLVFPAPPTGWPAASPLP